MQEEEDLSSMAWPGFVDILSSVIIMFVFFVLVIASALYFHIIIFKAKILVEISEASSVQSTMEELETTNRSLTKKIEEMTDEMKILEQVNEDNEIQLFKEDSGFAESLDQDVIEDSTSKTVTIYFGQDSISLTKSTQDVVAAIANKYMSDISAENMVVSILSNKSPNNINDIISRRFAVARMLNVRNTFLNGDLPKNQIKANIVEEEMMNDTYNWVQIKFSRK